MSIDVAPRRRGALSALAGLVLMATVAGCSGRSGGGSGGAGESPSTESAPAATAAAVLRNGQLTSVERYLGRDHGTLRDFDLASGTGLFVTSEGLAVVDRTGPLATLKCGRDVPCSATTGPYGTYPAALGPGPDEVTVASGDRAARVIGYDGTLRRTIDLTATITAVEDVAGLRWSPDGSRLAVVTGEVLRLRVLRGGRALDDRVASRVWLVDREGSDAQLAYSLLDVKESAAAFDAAEFEGCCRIWNLEDGWSWSPDGQALMLPALSGEGRHSPRVVVLHLPPDGAADRVRAQVLHSPKGWDDHGNVVWSPDGTRIAVQDGRVVRVISADDGRILAQHEDHPGWLIWPAKPR
jgi:dipeptidyl aminopeptidase/acylaminoacyl peptidase